MAIRRWQAFTGRQAVRESDGTAFVDLERRQTPAMIEEPTREQASAKATPTTFPKTSGINMRGRKPTPTRLKVITGNPGKRPLNEDRAAA